MDSNSGDSAGPADNVRRTQADLLEEYHAYLEKHYQGGVDRFFSPTGFLRTFEHTVRVQAEEKREAVFVRDMDDATGKLKAVVDGGEGVYDLVAEPGSGKTTVLPFRFPDSRVVVAMPTPFEAWSAFNCATGDACLRLKGLTLGRPRSKVCYMDSYYAANMVLSGFEDYDVLIVDECDSGKGVTRFLADVRSPGKVLVRMSATHGRSSVGVSRAFGLSVVEDMPDVRSGVDAVVEYVVKNAKGRALLLAPDAETAARLHTLIPESRLISSRVNLGEIARFVLEQHDEGVFVSDDVCARGLNLNLDMVFDCQLVNEHGVVRHVTDAELYQRKGRAGRNKPGWYHCPGLPCCEAMDNDVDVVRSNVVRAAVGVSQQGSERAHVDPTTAVSLLHESKEPYLAVVRTSRNTGAVGEPVGVPVDASAVNDGVPAELPDVHSRGVEVPLPDWLMWGLKQTGRPHEKCTVQIVRDKRGRKSIERRRSSGSGSGAGSGSAGLSMEDLQSGPRRAGPLAPLKVAAGAVAPGAPYASVPVEKPVTHPVRLTAPVAPPVMDLSASAYEFEWPSLLVDLADKCGDLPTIVPPGSWRYTALGGMGANWLGRLEALAVAEPRFTADEFELVCRAWNLMVASTWVKRTPGLSAETYIDKMEFCLRYFQMYYLVALGG